MAPVPQPMAKAGGDPNWLIKAHWPSSHSTAAPGPLARTMDRLKVRAARSFVPVGADPGPACGRALGPRYFSAVADWPNVGPAFYFPTSGVRAPLPVS